MTLKLCERTTGLIYPAVRDDLGGRPLYVLHVAELPPPYDAATVRGWTGATEDIRFRALIDERIGWRGRGPCVVVSGDCLLSVCGVAVHEIAHCIERAWTYEDAEPLDPFPAERFIDWTDEQRNQTTGECSRASHGLAWHRTLAHIVARVNWGRELEEINGWIGAGSTYSYSDWRAIRFAFRSELWTRRDEPIKAILASPAPAEAVQLFV